MSACLISSVILLSSAFICSLYCSSVPQSLCKSSVCLSLSLSLHFTICLWHSVPMRVSVFVPLFVIFCLSPFSLSYTACLVSIFVHSSFNQSSYTVSYTHLR